MTSERLHSIHDRIADAAHLAFVPSVMRTLDGHRFIRAADRLWELTSWMPGEPKLASEPTRDRISLACAAIAQLHRSWLRLSTIGSCPAVRHRLELLAAFHAQSSGPRAAAASSSMINHDLNQLIRNAIAAHIPKAENALRSSAHHVVPLQPCLRDFRPDHVLFTNDTITGIIDYGAVAVDYPGIDLARLLSDAGQFDDDMIRAAVTAYHDHGGHVAVTVELVALLCRSGPVSSLLGWLHRLETPQFASPEANKVRERINTLLLRLQHSSRI